MRNNYKCLNSNSILYNFYLLLMKFQIQEESAQLPSIKDAKLHRAPKDPFIKQLLVATKIYNCECGYSNRLSFNSIESHAKRKHNVRIDKSPTNYLIQIYNNKQYYTYFLNPRPQIVIIKDEQSHVKELPSIKLIRFRQTMDQYAYWLKSNRKKFDQQVLSLFRRYLNTIKHEISDEADLPDDLVYYFNEYIMSEYLLKKLTKDNQENVNDIIIKHAESLKRFFIYLKENNRTSLELEFRKDFYAVKQECQE